MTNDPSVDLLELPSLIGTMFFFASSVISFFFMEISAISNLGLLARNLPETTSPFMITSTFCSSSIDRPSDIITNLVAVSPIISPEDGRTFSVSSSSLSERI